MNPTKFLVSFGVEQVGGGRMYHLRLVDYLGLQSMLSALATDELIAITCVGRDVPDYAQTNVER